MPCFGVHYDKIPLSRLKTDEGRWSWNEAFTHQRVMRFWNVKPPSKFYSYSQEDRAYMIVAYEEEMKVLAYQQKLDRIEQEKHSASLNNKSSIE